MMLKFVFYSDTLQTLTSAYPFKGTSAADDATMGSLMRKFKRKGTLASPTGTASSSASSSTVSLIL